MLRIGRNDDNVCEVALQALLNISKLLIDTRGDRNFASDDEAALFQEHIDAARAVENWFFNGGLPAHPIRPQLYFLLKRRMFRSASAQGSRW